jgi:hypothetical protein
VQKTLNNHSLYRSRITREFERTLKLLKQLQAERKTREEAEKAKQAADMEQAIKYAKFHTMKKKAFDPHKSGFVFSAEQVEAEIARRDQQHRVDVADSVNFDAENYLHWIQRTDCSSNKGFRNCRP